jgi:hypothetical protein
MRQVSGMIGDHPVLQALRRAIICYYLAARLVAMPDLVSWKAVAKHNARRTSRRQPACSCARLRRRGQWARKIEGAELCGVL